jgi:hypothetical protein
MKYLICLALSLALVEAATAQGRGDPYLGATVGAFSFEEQDDEVGLTIDDSTYAYHLVGGYRFSAHFALEGGLGRTQHIEESFNGVIPIGSLDFVNAEFRLLTVRALGFIPFEATSLLGGVGYHDAEIEYRNSIEGPGQVGNRIYSGETSHNGATLMGGFEINLERIDIRAQLEWFEFDGENMLRVDDGDAWDLSIGVLFSF